MNRLFEKNLVYTIFWKSNRCIDKYPLFCFGEHQKISWFMP